MNYTNLLKKVTHRDFNGGNFDYYGKRISCRLSNMGDVIVDIYDHETHAATLCLVCNLRVVETSRGADCKMIADILTGIYRDNWTHEIAS